MATEPILANETAQAYRVLCEFCSLLLVENPSEETLNRLIDQRELLREDPFSSVAPKEAAALFSLLSEVSTSGSEAFKTEVKRDYTYLFRMVGASHTSPYESVYRTDDRTMFGPTTLEVREAYRAYGVQVPKQGSVPDDHIGYEFSFLAHLMGVAANSEGEGAGDGAPARACDDARAFLSDHVLVFAPVYLANVQTRAKEPFYRAVAGIAQATIASLADVLDAHAAESLDEKAYLLAE